MTLRWDAIEEVGPFDVRFKREDTEYWVRLLQRYRFAGIEKPLYVCHTHDNRKFDSQRTLPPNLDDQIEGAELFFSETL